MTRELFKELAEIHEPHCVSVYMPTHRAGQMVNEKIDVLMLKNKIKEVKTTLLDYQMNENEADKYLKPLTDLLEATDFWNNQQDGLVLFLTPKKGLSYYRVPMHMEEYTYVADHLYLKPLIPLFAYDKKYYLLTLSQKEVSLYEANQYKIEKLDVDEFLPQRIEEVVGADFKDKSLQFRTGHGEAGEGMFHGHGSGKDDYKEEVDTFLQHVDSGIKRVLNREQAPLVVAAVEYIYGHFKEITGYNHIYDDYIEGNPDESYPQQLHKEANKILADYFTKEINEKHRLFEEAIKANNASCDLEEIIPSTVDGRTGSLFIRPRAHLYGLYDAESRKVITEKEKNKNNSCLYNLAAIETINNGGEVFITREEEMPDKSCEISAIFRY